jgi:tRNA dimethylallyltransferase
MAQKAKVLVICGPTAGGKSARALALAAERGGVVINADSMQIYDALPILTARPSVDDETQAPHRLYGVLPPQEACSAQRWRDLAVIEIDKALVMGQTPILVGGTGLYLKALMEGFSPIPDVPPEFRVAAMEKHQTLGNPAFHGALAAIDPIMAARLHPNDTQRLIRAYEVITATGKSLAQWQECPPVGAPSHLEFDVELIVPERDELYRRCNARFDAMMENGALAEVKVFAALIENGSAPETAAVTNALGFKALRRYLHGELLKDEAVTLAKTETRQYAKRQVTWFRHQLKG